MSSCLSRVTGLPSSTRRINPLDGDHQPLANLSHPAATRTASAASSTWMELIGIKKQVEETKTELPPPYVHPLVKRSSTWLCNKSLDICTESLCSESGSDQISVPVEEEFGSDPPLKYNHITTSSIHINKAKKKNGGGHNRSSALPPAMPSINLKMRSHRQNGRLVLEAVSAPSATRSCFQVERQNGRLLLTFIQIGNEADSNDHLQEDKVVDVIEGIRAVHNHYCNDVVPVLMLSGQCNKLLPCRRPLILLKEPLCIAATT